jgi:hypothetical protein
VKLVDAADDCDAPPAEEVAGISCPHSPFVCNPEPAAYADSSATWSLTVLSGSGAMDLKVCYCVGLCYDVKQYVPLPGVLAVGSGITFTTNPIAPTTAAAFSLVVQAAIHDIRIVSGTTCNNGTTPSHSALTIGGGQIVGGTTTFQVAKGADYGDYLVCVRAESEFLPIFNSGAVSRFLTIGADYLTESARVAGPYTSQYFSLKYTPVPTPTPPPTVPLVLGGIHLQEEHDARIAVSTKPCAEAAKLSDHPDLDFRYASDLVAFSNELWIRLGNESQGTLIPKALSDCSAGPCELTFQVTLENVPPGKYSVCYCSNVAAAADFDPPSELEIDRMTQPNPGLLASMRVTKDDITYWTALTLPTNTVPFRPTHNDEPTLADVLRAQGFTRDDVLTMVAYHFNLQRPSTVTDRTDEKLRAKFEEVVSKVVNTTDQDFGTYFNTSALELFKEYDISRADLFYLAVLGILRGPLPDEEVAAYNESSPYPLLGDRMDSDIYDPDTDGRRRGPARQRRRTVTPLIQIGGKTMHTTSENAHRRRTVSWPAWTWYNKKKDSVTNSKLSSKNWDDWHTKALKSIVQWPGGKCGGPTQFVEQIGSLHITSRVDLDQTYVLPTDQDTSLEVTGSGLSPASDKIMIVGCQSTCGAGEPAVGSIFTSMADMGADEILWKKSSRGDLVPSDGSTSSVLRFSPVRFPEGGTFKVCFCDTEAHPGTFCNTTADFSLEVGTVHVSGVGCLLEDPRLRSGNFQCKEMRYGGLSCAVEVAAFE